MIRQLIQVFLYNFWQWELRVLSSNKEILDFANELHKGPVTPAIYSTIVIAWRLHEPFFAL